MILSNLTDFHNGCRTDLDPGHLLQLFLNNCRNAVFILNEKLEIICCSPAAERSPILNKTIFAREPITSFIIPEEQEEFKMNCEKALAGITAKYLLVVQPSAANEKYYEFCFSPAKDETAAIVGVVVTSADITVQQQREQELKSSNERYELVMQATSDAIWDYDMVTGKVYFNESFTRYFGHELKEGVDGYQLWTSHIHKEDLERVLSNMKEAIDKNLNNWDDEYRFILADGTIAYVYDRGMIVRNASGQPTRLIGAMQDISKQKQHESKLLLDEHRFRMLVQSGMDLVGIVDDKGYYTYMTSTVKQLEYEVADLIGKNAFEFIHPDDVKKLSEAFTIIQHTTGPVRLTPFRFKAGNGEWRWIETVVTNLLADSSVNGIVVNSRDITEKKRSDEVLEKAINDLNKVLDSSVDVITVTDAQNRYTRVSAAAESLWGYHPQELIGKDRFSLVHPEDRERTIEATNKLVKGDRVTNFQNRYIRKDGSVVPLIWSAKWDEKEQVMYSIARDATEKLKAEEALKSSEAMFRAISESFPNGIVSILNKELRFEFVAGKELNDLQLPATYFIGTHYSQHFPAETGLIEELSGKVFKGEPVVDEIKFMSRNYLLSSVPLYENDNTVNKILVVAQNITQLKQVQKEKQSLITELTETINDLKQFSYITSHNLRAPISNLVGLLELINMQQINDEDTCQLIDKLKESTMILSETVEDLMSILMLKNSTRLQKEPVSLEEVFDQVCRSVNSQLQGAGATIHADFSGGSSVLFNKAYAESILLNLVTNAIKYRSKERPLHLEIKTSIENDYIVLHFSDNGIGFNLERNKEKVFGLYQRFHDFPDSKGLGLYIVHSQITALGGDIEVQSEINVGTSFKIYFKR